MPYISLQYHRQVPAPGPIFGWQGIGPARTWRSAATANPADSIPKLDFLSMAIVRWLPEFQKLWQFFKPVESACHTTDNKR